jgi:3-hydroxyisobutyrate dehydrogenase-like beta-hydroxyacid dehydrogenase
MLRSIFSKGLEALILELLIAGRRAGIEASLWDDVCEFMTKNPFDRAAANWIETHPAACQRRYHEMAQVRQTLRDIGVPALMTMAAEAFFDRSRSSGLADSGEDAVSFLERRLR